MKTRIENVVVLFAVLGALDLLPPSHATAQVITTLHTFSPTAFVNSDGERPSSLIVSGNALYGTTTQGGTSGNGTIFKVNSDGTGFTALYSFSSSFFAFDMDGVDYYTNSDGAAPGDLLLSGGVLYGTSNLGGTNGNGTVFKINTDGTVFATLRHFTGNPDSYTYLPYRWSPNVLVLSGDALYGTANGDGTNGNGTVFRINTDGTGFATLHTFTGYNDLNDTNDDGADPSCLIVSGDTLYGAAFDGGSSGNGTLFQLGTDGTDFTVLHSFTALQNFPTVTNGSVVYGLDTNTDGATPTSLIFSNNTLYGTSDWGGNFSRGGVFKLNADGTGFMMLHNFADIDGNPPYTNNEGAYPISLVLSGESLYGAASESGTGGWGAIFKVNTDGSGFSNLYNFPGGPYTSQPGSDGSNPNSLVLSGHVLYGTANRPDGTTFKLETDGAGFAILHSFTASTAENTDGENPYSLIFSNDTLYGATGWGGSNGDGTVYKLNADGTGFTNLYNFNQGEPAAGNPPFGLILSGNTLYGTDCNGGSGFGTLFKIGTDGSSFTTLHTFDESDGTFPNSLLLAGNMLYGIGGTIFKVNIDGTDFMTLSSEGGNTLILAGDMLYAVASGGGTNGNGSVFALDTNGASFAVLYTFTASLSNTNGDGSSPNSLILSGDTLYGTAQYGGANGSGTIFKLNTNGTGFTILHTFTADNGYGNGCGFCNGNSDGSNPTCLALAQNILYGAANEGGTGGLGTIFQLDTDGSGFTNLYNFYLDYGGLSPTALILSGNTLYGIGSFFNGTVFRFTLPAPQLAVNLSKTILSTTNLVLTWPTSVAGISCAGYALQSATNLDSPVVWTHVAALPAVVNGQYTVTNPFAGPQCFFRLTQ